MREAGDSSSRGAKILDFPAMFVQIVLVIVTAVQVNSQEVCPSVCECDSEQATCTNLFSDVTDMSQQRFHAELRVLRVHGTTNLELEEDRFLRWNIASLTYLDLSQNNITNIWQGAFHSLASLQELYLQGNSITKLHSQSFYNNTRLVRLSLAKNRITDIDPSTFENNVRLRHLDVSENKLLSINPDTFSHNWDLEWLHFGSNSITYIHPSTFRNSSRLHDLNISGNKITSIAPETFTANLELQWLNLNDNSITNIHPSTFRGISKLRSLNISENKLASISPGTFDQNRDLQWLILSRNRIADIHPSVFQRNSGLRQLDISGNKITLINPDTFINNKKLTFLHLQYNNISHINASSFLGLEQLKHLDLSNNNIHELNPRVFDSFSMRTYEQNHQVSKLQHLNLAKNKIRSFNFEIYFPMSRIFDTSILTFELESFNVSSNRLDSLGAASVKWLNHRTTITDLSGNPWNCDCSALGEAWTELKHKFTLNCASPDLLRGRTWDVIGTSCPDRILYMGPPDSNKQNASSGASPNITETDRGPALNRTLLVVNGVLLVCTIVGAGFIVVQIRKKRRKSSEVSEHDEVCISLTQTGSSFGVSSRFSLESTFATGHIYERID